MLSYYSFVYTRFCQKTCALRNYLYYRSLRFLSIMIFLCVFLGLGFSFWQGVYRDYTMSNAGMSISLLAQPYVGFGLPKRNHKAFIYKSHF